MSDYKTVREETNGRIYEKKSEFIGYIAPAKTEEEAQDFLAKIRKKHYDANHNCYAYIIKDENVQRQSDDGEPSKTAGMPILEVLRYSGLEDVIIVVTRYFGGTLLGTGGLVKAYTEGAKAAIESATILSYSLCIDISITVEYPLYDRITCLCEPLGAKVVKTQFTENVDITVRMIKGTEEPFIKELAVLTKGKIPTITDEFLDIF